jgi:serine protease
VDAVGGGGGNTPPVANFTSSVSGLTVSFTDTSSDSDGSIASRSWNFGDGTTSTATNPSKTYSAAGTYTVTLTVTDDDGATNAKSSQVTVSSGGGGSVLQNGVPVTGISGAQGSQQFWTMNVPAGASNLQFQIAGGSGDADMYVRFGSAPTTSSYNCRPYLNGNNETCTFSALQAGTYHVMLRGYTSYSGVSLTGSYSAGGGGGPQTYSNGTDVNIPDNTTVESPISVSGRSGNAGSSVPVAVNIVHTYIGDLKVDLVAPDGSVYVLHNRSGGSANNINQTYNVNLSSEALNGTWKLRVNDNANFDTGYINSWSVTF